MVYGIVVVFLCLRILLPPRSTRTEHSFPTRRSADRSAFVAQSRSEQTQAIALRNLAVIDTRQQIASAQTEVANAAATARAAGGPGLAAAQEAARIARIGWTQGKFDQIALLDAERTLSQTRQDRKSTRLNSSH